jgi:isocitrate dehydrogenase (NAD+)
VISRNVALRNELDLFVNVLHCKSFTGVPAHHENIDIMIVRQNTEGDFEFLPKKNQNIIYLILR